MFRAIMNYVLHKENRFAINTTIGINNLLSDSVFLKKKFKFTLGYDLDLDNPVTFNQKLQWLKLYDRNPAYVQMVDKYAVKQYVSAKIGEQYVIPTLAVWERAEDITWYELPDRFVLKVTHDSGGYQICTDKRSFDRAKVIAAIKRSLRRNYYLVQREWPYKDVPRRIIAEQYMEDKGRGELLDYKFMCFGGKVKCSFVCSDRSNGRGLKVTFYDRDWNLMPFQRHYTRCTEPIPKPENYDLMIEIAEKLSDGIPFVRVDLYEIEGKVYFGELTFYPGSGFEEFTPFSYDEMLGTWITLPSGEENKHG